MKICKHCGEKNADSSRQCDYCGRILYSSGNQASPRTVIMNPFRTGVGRFRMHGAVIDRIATDVATVCSKPYNFKRNGKTQITLFFTQTEIFITSYDRLRFCDYGMGNMNVSDIPDFRSYFRSVFENKFRTALDSIAVGGRYSFSFEDYSYDQNYQLKVTIWFTPIGLTAW